MLIFTMLVEVLLLFAGAVGLATYAQRNWTQRPGQASPHDDDAS